MRGDGEGGRCEDTAEGRTGGTEWYWLRRRLVAVEKGVKVMGMEDCVSLGLFGNGRKRARRQRYKYS